MVSSFLAGQQPPYGADDMTAAAIIHCNLISDRLPIAISYA